LGRHCGQVIGLVSRSAANQNFIGERFLAFGQTWYSPDGSEALQYQASGDAPLFGMQDKKRGASISRVLALTRLVEINENREIGRIRRLADKQRPFAI